MVCLVVSHLVSFFFFEMKCGKNGIANQIASSSRCKTLIVRNVSFCRSFLCDNFDYDEDNAMELLASYGLIDNLFEVGKVNYLAVE